MSRQFDIAEAICYFRLPVTPNPGQSGANSEAPEKWDFEQVRRDRLSSVAVLPQAPFNLHKETDR